MTRLVSIIIYCHGGIKFVTSYVEGLQVAEEEEDIAVVLKHGAVCLGPLQEEKSYQLIPVSLHICVLQVSKEIQAIKAVYKNSLFHCAEVDGKVFAVLFGSYLILKSVIVALVVHSVSK